VVEAAMECFIDSVSTALQAVNMKAERGDQVGFKKNTQE